MVLSFLHINFSGLCCVDSTISMTERQYNMLLVLELFSTLFFYGNLLGEMVHFVCVFLPSKIAGSIHALIGGVFSIIFGWLFHKVF